MKKNMGSIDRGLRLLAVAIIAALYFTQVATGALAIALGIVALVFLATGAVGFCPLYVPLGLSTRKDAKAAAPKI